jgi:hypothetical protein
MRGCARTFCPNCDEEMIHRDHRHGYESASALGQIVHREGPYEIQYGDIDGYAVKWMGDQTLFRLLEHKQKGQALGTGQGRVFTELAQALDHAVGCPESPVKWVPGSGFYIITGPLEPETAGHRKVDFAGKQVLKNLANGDVFNPTTRIDLWNWVNGGPGWRPRKGVGRSW